MRILKKLNMKKLPHVILFDLDNTLYSYQEPHKKGIEDVKNKVIKKLGITSSQFDIAFDEAKLQIKSCLGEIASSHSRLLYFQRMLEILGLGSQILLALDFEQTYWRSYLSQAELFIGVREFLEDIRILGIPMVIVTDLTAQIQFRKIIYFGLEQYFDYVVTSEECQFDKPYAGVFELALKKISPQGKYYWMIGDNLIKDIMGAKKAIEAVTFQKFYSGGKIDKDDNTPDVIFEDFIQLRNLLFKITKEVEMNENCEVENA